MNFTQHISPALFLPFLSPTYQILKLFSLAWCTHIKIFFYIIAIEQISKHSRLHMVSINKRTVVYSTLTFQGICSTKGLLKLVFMHQPVMLTAGINLVLLQESPGLLSLRLIFTHCKECSVLQYHVLK